MNCESPLGLYVHVPFCSALCNYCNFNRGLFDGPLKTRYVDALVKEIEGAGGERLRPADTIYFGGGTPSLLQPDEIARIIAACESSVAIHAVREVTLEANPESITVERMRAYREAGVNRVSVGVQSFRDDELVRLSRLHNAARARTAIDEVRAAGIDNVSLDLMMWLPGQSVAQWLESVDEAVAVSPDHLSFYMLEVYPNAPLKEEMARARTSQAPDEDVETMYLTALERLDAAGYLQYEISNVSRPGRASAHNLKYWTDGEWRGFGCGAHSTENGVRWKNIADTEAFVTALDESRSTAIERRAMSHEERLGDALFTGLRLVEGVSLDRIQRRYGVDAWARFGRELAPFAEAGILLRDGDRLRLSRRGMLMAHEVMAVFV